jgi:hypothetical protein
MLLTERAGDDHVTLHINLGHLYSRRSPSDSAKLTSARRFALLIADASSLRRMILCFRFGQLPMDQHPFADVVETFFGHSLKPTKEPHTADTL